MDKLFENVKNLLEERGESERSLAVPCGVSHATPNVWFKNGAIPLKYASRLARHFGVSEYELRYGNPSRPRLEDYQAVLEETVRQVQLALNRRETTLDPDKYASLVVTLVEVFAPTRRVDPAVVERYVAIAA